MKIVLLGANGQVASEVAILLHGLPGVEVVPVSRTRNGSAFLRSRGVPVMHGSITDSVQARILLSGAGVVANFALASGLGRTIVDANHSIIQASIDHAEPTARIVFFSTLAIHGIFGPRGERTQNAYGDLKLRNEKYFTRAVARSGNLGFILRLGHVCGEEQNITHLIRSEIASGDVLIDDLERASNTTHVVAIAEALLAIAEGRAKTAGRYDLVNQPQWSWRQVYEYESLKTGRTLVIRRAEVAQIGRQPLLRRAMSSVLTAVDRLGIKPVLERVLPYLPTAVVERIKLNHSIKAARQEIAALTPPAVLSNTASWWPALDIEPLPGVRNTQQLIDEGSFLRKPPAPPWPRDQHS